MSKPIVWHIAGTAVGVHVDALSPEQAALDRDGDGYVERHEALQRPVASLGQATSGDTQSWDAIVAAGRQREAELSEAGWAKFLGSASKLGASYQAFGRPGVNYALMRASSKIGGTAVALDGVVSAGLTAAGSVARGEDFGDAKVLGSIISSGLYEGGSAWVAAKAGLVVGAKTALVVGALSGPAAPIAAPVAGVIVGLTTAIGGKYLLDRGKDAAVRFFHASFD